ncbi:hypothetical protein [Microcoleus sp. PH2017_13_LAR_U_A]
MKGSYFYLTRLWGRTIALHLLSWLLRRPPAEDSSYDQAGGKDGD